jgi:hypothetical protein
MVSAKRQTLFTAMTWARRSLTLTSQGELPPALLPLADYITGENANPL